MRVSGSAKIILKPHSDHGILATTIVWCAAKLAVIQVMTGDSRNWGRGHTPKQTFTSRSKGHWDTHEQAPCSKNSPVLTSHTLNT